MSSVTKRETELSHIVLSYVELTTRLLSADLSLIEKVKVIKKARQICTKANEILISVKSVGKRTQNRQILTTDKADILLKPKVSKKRRPKNDILSLIERNVNQPIGQLLSLIDNVSLRTLQRHLSQLEKKGLIRRVRNGRQVVYKTVVTTSN